ncbi:GNAT family N-acetyltransferase [Schaalia vaccimaxillae]|uniref:GNAT family N-acetyltransferase n=1 Tax=Schaalia vaccimaxillae TaxID=183916 RepID=UPI0003B3E314|nr:GNAT family protein [Schaalia vaccimaxillae]
MPLFARVWGRLPGDLTVICIDPVGRGFIRPSSTGASPDPQRIVIRPALGSDHVRIDTARRKNHSFLGQWEATLPAGSDEVLPSLREYCRQADRQARRGEALVMVVEADGVVIGQFSLSNVVRGAMSQAMLGYWLVEAWAGRGVGALAGAVVLDLAIGELGLHRVEICVRPENGPSMALCHKLGLRREGVRERYMHIGGQWADHVAFVCDAEGMPAGGLVLHHWGVGLDEPGRGVETASNAGGQM